ncbi:MAG: methylmalonyl-CoA epimerase [Bacillota bacterium]
MIKKIDHLGIAVKNIEQAAKFYTDTLALTVDHIEVVPEQKVKTAMIMVGESRVELLEPTDPTSPVAKFLETRGEGIHHVAYSVENVAEALAHAKASGARLIDETPRIGAGGAKIAFIHPKSSFGVLVELCQRDSH